MGQALKEFFLMKISTLEKIDEKYDSAIFSYIWLLYGVHKDTIIFSCNLAIFGYIWL